MANTNKKSCRKPLSKPSKTRVKFITDTSPTTDFVAMVPFTLKEVICDWQPEWPDALKEFPRNILFANSGELRGSLYEPDFATFLKESEIAELTYRTVMPSEFTVKVVVNEASGAVETHKCEGDELVRLSHGPDVKGAMMMTTMHGIDPHEPASIGARAGRDEAELRSCIADRWPPPPEHIVREPLVYGLLHKSVGDENLVFIPERQAHRLAAIYSAIHRANAEETSWQLFWDLMPLDDLWYVVSDMRDRGIKLPPPTEAFDDRMLPPSFFDGDWPDWAEQMMFEWLPRGICLKYGTCEASVHNGDFLILDVSRKKEILQALAEDGFELRHDEKLVARACGYSAE